MKYNHIYQYYFAYSKQLTIIIGLKNKFAWFISRSKNILYLSVTIKQRDETNRFDTSIFFFNKFNLLNYLIVIIIEKFLPSNN